MSPSSRTARVVVIGGSAGALEPLRTVCSHLNQDLPAPVLVVLHIPSGSPSLLPRILGRSGPLPAHHPADGQVLEGGHVYVAPPGRHLLVDGNVARLSHGPHENRHRPAIDPLFRTAAASFGEHTLAVLLSGARDDGSAGAVAVDRAGGTVVVQDPEDAPFAAIPSNAILRDDPDLVLPAAEIGPAISRMAVSGPPIGTAGNTIGGGVWQPSDLSCPHCGGVLHERDDGVEGFRCRVGHAYAIGSLATDQSQVLEATLWAAVRLFEERAALSYRMAESARRRSHHAIAKRFDEVAVEARERAAELHRFLMSMPAGPAAVAEDEVHERDIEA